MTGDRSNINASDSEAIKIYFRKLLFCTNQHNSVLSRLSLSLSVNIHLRMSNIHRSMATTASVWLVAEWGLNDGKAGCHQRRHVPAVDGIWWLHNVSHFPCRRPNEDLGTRNEWKREEKVDSCLSFKQFKCHKTYKNFGQMRNTFSVFSSKESELILVKHSAVDQNLLRVTMCYVSIWKLKTLFDTAGKIRRKSPWFAVFDDKIMVKHNCCASNSTEKQKKKRLKYPEL